VKYLRYRSTNCFFIEGRDGELLAFDAGWPCSLYEYRRAMKAIGLRFEDIRLALVSHMHMDHAGLLGEFLAAGIECFAFEGQREAIAEMERVIMKNAEYRAYRRIDGARLRDATISGFSGLLEKEGFPGEVIATRGHSPDSVSFLTDRGEALIGDLPPIDQVMDEDFASKESWAAIRARGATRIFPSHAAAFELTG
jgi:glyoxylase-like metal-dependent hydrolase (beta-lactamase superfamily II)